MVFYKGKELVKTADKKAGKNRSGVDGFYRDANGREYFIKRPEDKKELFTELFAGLLLKEFIKRKLIDPVYFSSLICADLIKFEDGSYGLIQPKVSFKVLYDIIGTGYKDGSDRDPLYEMVAGPSHYPTLTQQGNYYGLSTALMFSLLLGDYSVHSGNVVVLDKAFADIPTKVFARIDWGASFRYFANEKNNQDILNPYEYQGLFNFKGFTKGYFANYKNIYGLFTAIAAKALELVKAMTEVSMQDVVNSALSQIPADMLDSDTQRELADYMSIPAFAKTRFGPKGNYKAVAQVFSAVLNDRLAKITVLQEQVERAESSAVHAEVVPSSALYQSYASARQLHKELSTPIKITIDPDSALAEQFELLLAMTNTQRPLDFSQIDLNALTRQFNLYVNLLAHQTDVFNLWRHDRSSNENIFRSYFHGDNKAVRGSAFVTQYRESTLLRRLFTLQENSLATPGFGAYEGAVSAYTLNPDNQNSLWVKINTSLSAGHAVINQLYRLQTAQRSVHEDDSSSETISAELKNLLYYLNAFNLSKQVLDKLIANNAVEIAEATSTEASPFFYPISDEELMAMNGEQLVTICLDELYAQNPSLLVVRIIKNDRLWNRLLASYSEEAFGQRLDQPRDKIARLQDWRSQFSQFYVHKNNFHVSATLDGKERAFAELRSCIQALPPVFLDDNEVEEAYRGTLTVINLWRRNNLHYLNKEQNFLADKSTASYQALQQAFESLPADLAEHYQRQMQAYTKETEFLQKLACHSTLKAFDKAASSLVEIQDAFEDLDPEQKLTYREELAKLQLAMANWQSHQNFLNEHASFERRVTGPAKKAALPKLKKAFAGLTESLRQEYQAQMDAYNREDEFLGQFIPYQKIATIQDSRRSFPPLSKAFAALSEEQKSRYQQSFDTLAAQNLCYEILLRNEVLQGSSNAQGTNKVLAFLENTGKLKTAALQDKKLWKALDNSSRGALSKELTQDLLIIKKFYQDRVQPKDDEEFDEKYNRSLDNFYQKALDIRLSNQPIKVQAKAIIKAAHKEFEHRDKGLRLLADGLMLVSILFCGLGVAIMSVNYYKNKSVFFSGAPTERENLLTSEWMTKLQDLPEEDGDLKQPRLFSGPSAASAA